MRTRALLLPVFAAALALPGLAVPAQAVAPARLGTTSAVNPARSLADHLARHGGSARATTQTSTDPGSDPVFLSARLSGRNELLAADPTASAKAAVEIDGSEVVFAFSWKNMPPPTLAHIHRGGAGVAGPVVVPLIMSAMPEGTTAGVGSVTVDDVALADDIRSHPAAFYVNLHTTAFPAGAARSQLKPDDYGFDAIDLFKGLPLTADMDGAQEVPGPGDPDGYAYGGAQLSGSRVKYAFAWLGLAPTLAHIHQGAAGVAGPDVVPLLMGAVPDTLFAVAGEMPLERSARKAIRADPGAFYLNLHTVEYPAGAVRGQLQDAS